MGLKDKTRESGNEKHEKKAISMDGGGSISTWSHMIAWKSSRVGHLELLLSSASDACPVSEYSIKTTSI